LPAKSLEIPKNKTTIYLSIYLSKTVSYSSLTGSVWLLPCGKINFRYNVLASLTWTEPDWVPRNNHQHADQW